ncbi:MAG: flavodoxin domain-containing protein [Pseudomonadota bacterium]
MSLPVQAPVSPESQHELTALAGGWSADQQLWASGFLAGMAAARGHAAPASAPALKGTVLFGSQSGNGQGVAEALASAGADLGFELRAVNMADYAPARLAREELLFVVVSTHGEGDPPDDAADLWSSLADPTGPRLEQLRYAVLALGDSSYAHYCQTGRDFDERLAARGAQALVPRVECDLEYQEPAEAWRSQVLETLKEEFAPAAAPPRLRAVPASEAYTSARPFPALLEVNQKITGRDSSKDVRHLELSLDGSQIEWEPGDSLGVKIANPASIVDEVLEAADLDGDAVVRLADEETSLRQALTGEREITRLTRPVLERFSGQTDHPDLTAALADSSELAPFLFRHQVVDLLREYPLALDAQTLLDVLSPLAHRAYSIASDAQATGSSVHLTVARLTYEQFGRAHAGAASTSLADAAAGGEIPVFLDPNPRFRLPEDPATPVIMIGPGTGVAPFRAFVQRREAQGASGKNWLFFGDRQRHNDFLYQVDWLRWRKAGLLELDVAFSRDQEDKRYVQHVMAERGAEFYDWLESGAAVYVCGDASRMAPDVDQALTQLVQKHQARGAEAAAEYVQQLKRSGRYKRDVY